ncbi:hypothetical protein ACLB2K_013451 [Fragaria x ananassa]
MQKRYSKAKRNLTTLEQSLIKLEDLNQTPEQLRRTVDRLIVKPYAPLKRNKGAELLAPLRESALKWLSSTPGSLKRKSILERLGPVPVDKFTPSTSGTKAVATETEAKRIKSDPTPKKQVQEKRLQWRPKLTQPNTEVVLNQQVKEHVPEAKNDNTTDTSLVTAVVQTFTEIDATLVVQIVANEPKLAMDEDVSTDEKEGVVRMHCNMVYVISSKYALPKSRAVCSVTKTQEAVNEVASEMEKVTIDSTTGSSEGGPLEITDAIREWYMMFLRPSPAMMEHLRPLYVTVDIDGTKVSKILVDAGAVVSIMTVLTMTMLGIKKSSVIETAMIVKNFAGGVTKTLGILMVRLKVGPSNIIQGFFVTDCTTPYSYILGRDWINKAACVPSSMHQELLMPNPKPFSVSANEIGADYYNSDLRLLTVVGINQSGKSIGVTSTDLAQ